MFVEECGHSWSELVAERLRAYAEAGVDLISVGALTPSPRAADLSLELEAGPPVGAG